MCRVIMLQNFSEVDSQRHLAWFAALSETGKVPLGVSPGHQDGWGIGGFKGSELVLLKKESRSALENTQYDQAAVLASRQCDLIVGHLRKSSVGNVSWENTHPFAYRDFLFCHNGMISDSQKLQLDPAFAAAVKGTTDSERFFLYLMQQIYQAPDREIPAAFVREKIISVIDFIRNNFTYTGLNSILSNGDTTWAVREVNENNPIVQEKKMLDYYSLYLGIGAAGTAAVSSEIFEDQRIVWEPLKNHELAEIDGATGAVARHSF